MSDDRQPPGLPPALEPQRQHQLVLSDFSSFDDKKDSVHPSFHALVFVGKDSFVPHHPAAAAQDRDPTRDECRSVLEKHISAAGLRGKVLIKENVLVDNSYSLIVRPSLYNSPRDVHAVIDACMALNIRDINGDRFALSFRNSFPAVARAHCPAGLFSIPALSSRIRRSSLSGSSAFR